MFYSTWYFIFRFLFDIFIDKNIVTHILQDKNLVKALIYFDTELISNMLNI